MGVQIKEVGDSIQFGEDATKQLGFYGATPVAQQSGASQAAVSTAWVTVFKGTATAGYATATGVITGQKFDRIVNITTPGDATTLFTLTVPSQNVIAQTSTADHSAATFVAFGTVGSLANAMRTALVNEGLIKGSA